MKKPLESLLAAGTFLAVLVFLLMACSGCSSLPGMVTKSEVVTVRPAGTNTVATVATNFILTTNIVSELVTNATGTVAELLTPQITLTAQVFTNITHVVTPAVTVTNYELGDNFTKVVSGAGRVASNFGIPFADAATSALVAVAGVVFGFFNQRRARQALALADNKTEELTQTQSALVAARDVGTALVANFEQLRAAALKVPGYKEHDAAVMRGVQQLQRAMGVKDTVESIVDETTDYTTKAV